MKFRKQNYFLAITLLVSFATLTGCFEHPNVPRRPINEYVKIEPSQDGSLSFTNVAKKDRLEFKTCSPNRGNKTYVAKQETTAPVEKCPSKAQGDKLIDISTLEVQFYEAKINSVRCCVYIKAFNINACHVEPDNTCDYGTRR